MEPFLHQIASYIDKKYGKNLYRTSIIFPGRRAGVFFNAYLNNIITNPKIGPKIITISELVSELSPLQIPDRMSMIVDLFGIYKKVTGSHETLDEFYFWGDILLNDFNDIDNYLVPAQKLYENITDLKQIDQIFDFFSDNQKEALKTFWGGMDPETESENRKKFLFIWPKLGEIYRLFRERLMSKNNGYSGLIIRDIVENNKDVTNSTEFASDHYVFAGFNALNKCEKKLFQQFKKSGKAEFFWDYDERFIEDKTQEAGKFIRDNIIEFPMPEDFILDKDTRKPKVHIYSVPGQIVQSQIINQKESYIKENKEIAFDDSAYVLADENLLIPVVSALSSKCDKINITMGYPLIKTPIYSLLKLLIELQNNSKKQDKEDVFYSGTVISILKHQLIAGEMSKDMVSEIYKQNKVYIKKSELNKDDITSLLFVKYNNWRMMAESFMEIIRYLSNSLSAKEEKNSDNLDDIKANPQKEFLFRTYLVIQRLVDVLNDLSGEILSISLFCKILLRHLQRITVPFEGEPLTGIQVMGLLETRALDFKNLTIFSMNADVIPKRESSHSFVPYMMRKYFGMPIQEYQDAIFGYYFYRLIHRSENVTLVYDSSSDGLKVGEMSPFLLQLIYDSDIHPSVSHLNYDFSRTENPKINITKDKKYQKKLLSDFEKHRLSPSAINNYIDCNLKFYFQRICRISEPEEIQEEIDSRMFGNLFHYAAREIYSEFGSRQITADDLDKTIHDKKKINKAIISAFASEYYKEKGKEDITISGMNLLVQDNLNTYLKKLLEKDKAFVPFQIISLEKKYVADFPLKIDGKKYNINLGGTIDRIDKTKDGIRIIDYKTSRQVLTNFSEFEKMTDSGNKKRPKEIFQALIYSEVYNRLKGDNEKIMPNLYVIDSLYKKDFQPQILKEKEKFIYQDIAVDFREFLQDFLENDFFAIHDYTQTTIVDKCSYCPYNKICRRK